MLSLGECTIIPFSDGSERASMPVVPPDRNTAHSSAPRKRSAAHDIADSRAVLFFSSIQHRGASSHFKHHGTPRITVVCERELPCRCNYDRNAVLCSRRSICGSAPLLLTVIYDPMGVCNRCRSGKQQFELTLCIVDRVIVRSCQAKPTKVCFSKSHPVFSPFTSTLLQITSASTSKHEQ